MKPSDEQAEVVYSTGNVKCISVAGSGKSTMLMYYAQKRPQQTGLYIVYNNAARQEAIRKAQDFGIDPERLHIHTAHSFALKALRSMGIKIKVNRKNMMDPEEIIARLGLYNGSATGRYTIAKMVQDGIEATCNRMDGKIYGIDFKDHDKYYVEKYFDQVVASVNYFLREMAAGRLACTHDFYLKLFAKQNRQLQYDYILFDEGQDANEVMLHIFRTQNKCDKVIVGDPSQQIYSWRGAVNALNKVNYPKYTLQGSYRFGPKIAGMANAIVSWKKLIDMYGESVRCTGLREPGIVVGQTAYLCRNNIGLCKKMIDIYATRNINFYLEGGLQGNSFFSNGQTIADIYFLFAEKRGRIKSPMISGFKDIQELYDFAKNTGNKDLKTLIDLVFTYKGDIFRLKKEVKSRIVKNRDQAEAYFSTVHKAKGQEYAYVELDETFITHNDVKLLSEAMKNDIARLGHISNDLKDQALQMNEEINVFYVAVTRAIGDVRL